MKKILVMVFGAVLCAGCSKSDSGSGEEVGSNPLNAPAEYLGAVNQAQKSAVRTVDVAALTKAIDMFQVSEGRLPKDLNEVVQKGYIPAIPEAPRGSTINYDPKTGKVTVTK